MALITRPQLADFIRDPRTIRAFELLFETIEMSETIRTLVLPKLIEATQTTQYTVPDLPVVRAVIDNATISNVTGSAATIAINLVASGGTASSANLIVPAKSIAANTIIHLTELAGKPMESGSSLSTIAGTASALVLSVGGREIR